MDSPTKIVPFLGDMLVFRGVKDGFPLVAYGIPHGTHSPVETFPGLGASVRPSIAQHCYLVYQKVIAHRNPWDERYIYLHEWLICMVNVGRYTVHGCYGMGFAGFIFTIN